jgi:hypothetical protein
VKPADDDREAWELLGLSPGASIDEIRRAYQHLARALAPGSLTVYSVLEPHEQHDLQRRLHAAYRRLLVQAGGEADEPALEPPAAAEPAKAGSARSGRRAGRARPSVSAEPVTSAGPARATEAPPQPAAPSGAPAALPPAAPEPLVAPASEPEPAPAAEPAPPPADDEEFGGARLAARREAAGISIAEMSRRTRIRGALIAAVEAERWAELPPRVYLRGFVLAFARELKLDGERVWRDYEQRGRAATGGETG